MFIGLNLPPQGGLANMTILSPIDLKRFLIISKQSPSIHQIFFETPYILAFSFAHFRISASFSIAKTCSQRPESANAMTFPPAPANASTIIDFLLDACSAM
jgi:hypothetical protein